MKRALTHLIILYFRTSYGCANYMVLFSFFCIITSALVSCDKDSPNETKEKILTHEDSLALGLIVPPDTTTTQPGNPSTPPIREIEATIDGINYILNENEFTAYVTFKQGKNYTGNITIPEVVHYNNNEYFVTAIGRVAFGEDTIKSITIPSSVVCIGEAAFYWSKVEKVRIKGEGLKIIEGLAFDYCFRLGEINLPNSVTEIGWRAFHNCGLSSINLPSGLKEIKKEVFRACGLKSIIFPDNLVTIGEAAFLGNHFTTITLPATIKEIGPEAFAGADLRNIICYAKDVPKAEYNSFPFKIQNIFLHVPKQSISLYKETYPWNYAYSVSALEE